ncbi:MAG TPA: rhodanese-like domain-containing protein [Alphaproteobacteria bacterium]|jgi:glyoxylase-like metal-dependent hydrolase (beta-lactamase superfamily II)/rhodanese-related sulfurtransferase
MLIFRQLIDLQSSTYTYLLADPESRQAVLIDPVYEEAPRDAALIRELDLTLLYTLETHVHADHVTGAWNLKQRLGSRIAIGVDTGAEGADLYLKDRDRVKFGRRYLQVRATPGHTKGCLTYVLDDETMAFTGDCVLVRGCGRTDFQQGDPRAMYRAVHSQIFSLPESCLLYPAHDYRGLTVSSVGEEKRYNPRLGGELSEDDFVGYMQNLGLPHPKQMDIAVPANLKCGRREGAEELQDQPTWAPLNLTFAGIWEVQPHWVQEHLRDVQVIDVREPDEFDGPLGRIPGAISIPLGTLKERAAEISKDRPIVAVCRAGGRSAQATNILKKAGFERVANLAGGMLRWRAQRLAVENARD